MARRGPVGTLRSCAAGVRCLWIFSLSTHQRCFLDAGVVCTSVVFTLSTFAPLCYAGYARVSAFMASCQRPLCGEASQCSAATFLAVGSICPLVWCIASPANKQKISAHRQTGSGRERKKDSHLSVRCAGMTGKKKGRRVVPERCKSTVFSAEQHGRQTRMKVVCQEERGSGESHRYYKA